MIASAFLAATITAFSFIVIFFMSALTGSGGDVAPDLANSVLKSGSYFIGGTLSDRSFLAYEEKWVMRTNLIQRVLSAQDGLQPLHKIVRSLSGLGAILRRRIFC